MWWNYVGWESTPTAFGSAPAAVAGSAEKEKEKEKWPAGGTGVPPRVGRVERKDVDESARVGLVSNTHASESTTPAPPPKAATTWLIPWTWCLLIYYEQ